MVHFDIPAGALTKLTEDQQRRGRRPHTFRRPLPARERSPFTPLHSNSDSQSESSEASSSSVSNLPVDQVHPRTTSSNQSSGKQRLPGTRPSKTSKSGGQSSHSEHSSLPFARVEFEARESRAALANITLDNHKPSQDNSKVIVSGLAEVVENARVAHRFLHNRGRVKFDDDRYVTQNVPVEDIPRFFDSQVSRTYPERFELINLASRLCSYLSQPGNVFIPQSSVVGSSWPVPSRYSSTALLCSP